MCTSDYDAAPLAQAEDLGDNMWKLRDVLTHSPHIDVAQVNPALSL